MNRKKYTKLVVIIGIFLFLLILGISIGAVNIPPKEVVKALFIDDGSKSRQIIFNVRLHRILTASLAGACLAMSGTILQGIMRNPLAGPGTIGVNSGAGLMAVIILILLPEKYVLLPFAAFLGALLTTLFIYFLSYKDGTAPIKMILSGIAVASLLNAAMQSLFILFPNRVQHTVSFMVGGLTGTSWKNFYLILPFAIVGGILTAVAGRKLDLLNLGDEVARSLGVPVEKTRFILIVLSSMLAAASVSTVGLISFVGLMGPHMARLILGSKHDLLIPGAAFLGASLVVGCDTLGRFLFRPMEIPAGIIMSILGVPFFLFLLRQKKEG